MSWDMYWMTDRYIGQVEENEFEHYATQGFREVLHSFLATDVELYKSRMTDAPFAMRAVIENRTTDNPQFASLRQILCAMGTNLECGNYIKEDDEWWVVPYLPGNNGVYEKAYLWYCNYMLKFVSPLTGEVVTYPVHTENGTRYNAGERATTKMTIGTSQHIIYIPNNEETILLKNGVRFILDYNVEQPTVMRISQVDTTSHAYGGADTVRLLRLTMVEDQYNEITDDRELGVADYRRYNDPPAHSGSTMYG